MWSISITQIIIAFLMDLILGDPRKFPHIVRGIGTLSQKLERGVCWLLPRTIASGLIYWLLLCTIVLGVYGLVYFSLNLLGSWWIWGLEIIILYQTITAMDLTHHIRRVVQPLAAGNMQEARKQLSMIVGRDTEQLDEKEISRASIECVAESTHDGFVAPLFWAIIGGVPAALIYRTTNTLDSMVGHRTPEYEKFGKASARMDDLFNIIPARLTAFLYYLCRPFVSLKRISIDARKHDSPNAGWSEATLAYVMDVQLGGCNFYDGEKHTGPIFNKDGRKPLSVDVTLSLRYYWRVIVMTVFLLLSIKWLMEYT
ncbi:MAG: adenosylcobinamide-phosphate synthase CbiB [Verrucomicrobiota bacterium]